MRGAALALRTVLAIAYPFLAHAANARGDGVLAAIALGDLAAVLLVGPLLRREAWAWGLAALLVAVFAWLSTTAHATLPLLAPPVFFLALAGWLFARTLRRGRVPLVTRMAAALHEAPVDGLEPALARYTRALTGFWAALLFALALVNLVLAAVGSVGGSLFANLLVHGVVGGCFLVEYAWRRHRFPAQPYRDLPDFLRRVAALGPAFWRDVVR